MRVLTYHGLDLGGHQASFDKVRAAIERGDLRSADVKKLSPSRYYRAKLDDKNRLVLQFLRHGGETACLVLEVIENHAYDRSRFLRGATVNESRIDAEAATAVPEAAPIPFLHRERDTLHVLDKPISFDDAQEALLGAPAPLVVIGSAGSGKTALILSKLREAEGSVAYITQGSFLAESARTLYSAHGWARDDQETEFLSHRELLESIRLPPGKPVSFRAFAGFFARHRQHTRFADAHQCYEELRGVIGAEPEGPLSREAYVGLGPRQSIFARGERDALYTLFERYRAWIAEAGLYDPNFVSQEWLALAEPRYDFIVVNEVQDLTNAELTLALRMLKRPGQFVLCGDANQIVHPNFFSWSRLKGLFFRDEDLAQGRRVGVLEANYRNSRAVTRAANLLLEIKHTRFGSIDRESDALVRAVADEDGAVVILPDEDAVVRELDEKLRRSARAAVIVLRDEQKDEARRRFRTPLVFSVHEAKGLEYETVVLYGVVSGERAVYADLCDGVRAEELGREALVYGRARDKEDRSLEMVKFYVNALYVALTRAVKQVYLVERDGRHPLIELLGARQERDAKGVRSEVSSVEDWQAEARRLELHGKTEQAAAIRETVARTQKVPWVVIDRAGHDELAAKALAPNSIFTKAKQALFEWACFHDHTALSAALARGGFAPAERHREEQPGHWRRQTALFAGKRIRDVLDQTDRYGVDYRTPMGTTPLMLAAGVGNVPLIEALVARGARRDLVDPFGRAAMHYALDAAYADGHYARHTLGPVFERVVIPAIDLQVDGRLIRLSPSQGEYLVFAALTLLLPSRCGPYGRSGGITAEMIDAPYEAFGGSVLAPERRRRQYVNAVLARAERSSTYTPARRLWIRERRGEYYPNPGLSVREIDEHGEESWRPIELYLGLDLIKRHQTPWEPRRRLAR